MNVSSSTSSSALDALVTAMARQRSSAAGSKEAASYSATAETASTASGGGSCGSHEPASPSTFHVSLSTSQFAGSRGPQGGNPIAQLDGDGDGAVSAEEFGLDEAGSDVKELFGAIDTDSDGSLSSEELSSFDGEMRSKMDAGRAGRGERPDGPPPGPPPARPDEAQGSTASESSDSSESDSTSSSAQIQLMLQRIAQGYFGSLAGTEQASGSEALSLGA